MTWRLARSLDVLRGQVNTRWPARAKDWDGTIGDEAHSARKSDHNPNDAGVVCALDITNVPVNGPVSHELAETLRLSKDPRIKYIISDRRICSSLVRPWEWRDYNGLNPHDHHVHVSVGPEASKYDAIEPWVIESKQETTK